MSSKPELREWTVMFYLATDNPLAPGVISHLKAMKSAGYHPQVNVLAQFDPHGGNLPVHIFDVNRMEKLMNPDTVNIGFKPNDSYVRNLVTDKLWNAEGNKKIKRWVPKSVGFHAPVPSKELTGENDPQPSLRLFLDFCHREYPARHYMLFVLGHGLIVAGDTFLYDEHGSSKNGKSGPRSLLLKQLASVLGGFNKKIKGQGELELIGFHSCSMSGAEVALELKDKANYMLAAQGPAYVGVWPYRQILIRLFNDLGQSAFSRDDLETNDLIDNLKTAQEPTYEYFHRQLNGSGAKKLLSEHVVGTTPEPTLVKEVANKFGRILRDPKLSRQFRPAQLPHEIRKLVKIHEKDRINGEYLKWLNRQLLMSGLTQKARTGYTKANIKNVLLSIFKYCYFNGLDFQLAGYSSDLTLCNLRQVNTIEGPVNKLVVAMKRGLKAASKTKQLVRDLLVFAHWESQSFYEEKYTDLYDFCFCLNRKCEQAMPSENKPPAEMSPHKRYIDDIKQACGMVMDALKRGSEAFDGGAIIRSESCGPAYQYAHGLSVYFPWSEPIDNDTWRRQYRGFKFSEATHWHSFLKLYFKETMRSPQEDEKDDRDRDTIGLLRGREKELFDLLEDLSTASVYNDDGQLKVGSRDPLGPVKVGSLDPTGSGCDCGSIKNYPTISHSRRKNPKRFKGHRPTINLYGSYRRTFFPRSNRNP